MCTVGSFKMGEMVEPGPAKDILDSMDDEWTMTSAVKVLDDHKGDELMRIERRGFRS